MWVSTRLIQVTPCCRNFKRPRRKIHQSGSSSRVNLRSSSQIRIVWVTFKIATFLQRWHPNCWRIICLSKAKLKLTSQMSTSRQRFRQLIMHNSQTMRRSVRVCWIWLRVTTKLSASFRGRLKHSHWGGCYIWTQTCTTKHSLRWTRVKVLPSLTNKISESTCLLTRRQPTPAALPIYRNSHSLPTSTNFTQKLKISPTIITRFWTR